MLTTAHCWDRYPFWHSTNPFFEAQMPPSPRTLRTVGCATFYPAHVAVEHGKETVYQDSYFDQLSWIDWGTGARKVRKGWSSVLITVSSTDPKYATRQMLIDTFFHFLDRAKAVIDLWNDLKYAAEEAFRLGIVQPSLAKEIKVALKSIRDLSCRRLAYAEAYDTEVLKLSLLEKQPILVSNPPEMDIEKVTFDSFTLRADWERRETEPDMPWYTLADDPHMNSDYPGGTGSEISSWSLQVCDFLSQHDWSEMDSELRDIKLINHARATYNHLVVIGSSLPVNRKYNVLIDHIVRQCDEMLSGVGGSKESPEQATRDMGSEKSHQAACEPLRLVPSF